MLGNSHVRFLGGLRYPVRTFKNIESIMNNKMKKYILLLITSLTIISCFTDDELAFDFSDDLKKTVIPYQENNLI